VLHYRRQEVRSMFGFPGRARTREFPPADEILRERDRFTVWVEAGTWECPFDGERVSCLGADAFASIGRCHHCGAKLVLAPLGERVADHWEQIGQQRRACPDCGERTLVRFEWAHTALPGDRQYWRCAMPGGCWAGPYVMRPYRMGEHGDIGTVPPRS
jgi:DNA-directed RNA polymerase subunit RPC12/RpoP